MDNLGVGIIGCGNISSAYLRLAPMFKGLEMRAVADLNVDAAKARAEALLRKSARKGDIDSDSWTADRVDSSHDLHQCGRVNC